MPHYYGDEEIYFVMGRAWINGVPLYQAMFDHKPPLIYIMAGIAPTMFAFRALLAGVMVLHTILFWKLVYYIWGKTKPMLAYIITLVFVLITTLPTFEGLTVNAELLMMMPVTGAVLLLFPTFKYSVAERRNEWKRFLLGGLLGGIGWLFKIPVAADMMAIGLFFLVFRETTLWGGIKSLISKSFIAYTLAFVGPLALTFAYYYLKGTGPDYLATVLTVNLGYVSSWATSSYEFNPFKSGLFVRAIALVVFTIGLYSIRKKLDKYFVLSSLWFGFSLFGALLSARPYPHYLQEMAVPVALIIGFIFVTERLLAWIVIGIMIGTGVMVQKQINFWAYPTISVYKTYWEYMTNKINWSQYLERFDNAPRNYEIAQYLNERMSNDDKIYVWGTDPTIYNLTNRLPTGGKYIVSFHVKDLNMFDYTLENLEQSKPSYIIILPGSGDFPGLQTMIDHQYLLVKEVGETQVYLRIPQ